ncbi:MAG: tetratricopeptide repeat protein [Bacteroidales bacterium]
MDKNKLSEILVMDDSIVSMQDLVIMKRLSDKYPYCSVFKVIVVKFAYILQSFNKSQLLAITSIYVSDREYLGKIISNLSIIPKHINKSIPEKKKEDIITKINSYKDEKLSDNPTRQELLERFLKIEYPKTPANDKGEFTQDKRVEYVIKDSVRRDFKFVTENMAKIYAKQGDKSTAIKIYQQLIEKNPNKTMYYTHQIEILKNN